MSKRKELMAVLDATMRQLNKADEMEADAEAVRGVLDIRRAELAETEQRLAQTKESIVQADVEHTKWREAAAAERAKGNAAIDVLQEKLKLLEGQTRDAQAKFDNIIAGIRALTERLKVA
jgi:hypothetical protein